MATSLPCWHVLRFPLQVFIAHWLQHILQLLRVNKLKTPHRAKAGKGCADTQQKKHLGTSQQTFLHSPDWALLAWAKQFQQTLQMMGLEVSRPSSVYYNRFLHAACKDDVRENKEEHKVYNHPGNLSYLSHLCLFPLRVWSCPEWGTGYWASCEGSRDTGQVRNRSR